MQNIDFVTLLSLVQQHISEKYSASLANSNKFEQLRSYIEKYLRDKHYTVEGMTLRQLSDKLYSEMAEYSILTQYLGRDDIEEVNINGWDDVAITYVDGRIEKAAEHFYSPQHAVDIVKRLLHHKLDRKLPISVLAVGKTRLLATMSGYDLTLSQKDLSYAMISDLRERYHTGNNLMAVVKSYDEEADTVAISVKDAAPHPFDGADARHPVRSRRASSITGKYKGGVFCKLEENLDCLCTYSPSQYDENFNVGDEVIIAITKFDYRKKQVYGKIVAKW